MKKLLPLILFSGSLLMADAKIGAPAPACPAIEKMTIRFADAYAIIQNLEEWKDESTRIQQEIASRTNQIEALKSQGAKKAQELQAMMTTAKPNIVEMRREEIMDLQNKIQVKQQALEEFAQRVSQEAQMKILKSIEEATKEIAEERGYDIVFGGGALFVSKDFDISEEVASRMNKKYLDKKKRQEKTAIADKDVTALGFKK